jgi:xanthine dehydrogenase accessory factor
MAWTDAARLPVLVRGTGDIGSAIALALFRDGYPVLLHDGTAPATMRRGMAFADAVFDGTAVLDGVTARRVDLSPALVDMLMTRDAVIVTCAPFQDVLGATTWSAIIDARLRKRTKPTPLLGLAPITIGVGPNFVAGETVNFAIETSLDGRQGMIVESGPTSPLAGGPLPLGGVGRERFIYAPVSGRLRTTVRIGAAVAMGAVVATIADTVLVAPLAGVIRGLTHDDVAVASGAKVAEIDPRGDPSKVFGVSERPRCIAEGVHRVFKEIDARASNNAEKSNP